MYLSGSSINSKKTSRADFERVVGRLEDFLPDKYADVGKANEEGQAGSRRPSAAAALRESEGWSRHLIRRVGFSAKGLAPLVAELQKNIAEKEEAEQAEREREAAEAEAEAKAKAAGPKAKAKAARRSLKAGGGAKRASVSPP